MRSKIVTFPPQQRGQWRGFTPVQRREWLMVAKDYMFSKMSKGEVTDAPAGTVFTLNGANIDEEYAFYCALGEAVNGPGGYFGANDMSIQDCCFGQFGAALPFTIRIKSAEACRNGLGAKALETWARRCLQAEDYLDEDMRLYLEESLEKATAGERTLFDEFTEILESHGVRFELE